MRAVPGPPGPGPAAHRRGRVPVEDHRVVWLADQDLRARLGARVGERLLHAQAGQPVGQVADRLVVAEVGLLDPAPRLLAADQEGVLAEAEHLEARLVHVLDRDPDPDALGGLFGRTGGAVGGDQRGHGEAQLAQALPGGGGDLEDLVAARFELGLYLVRAFTGGRDVDLVQGDEPRPGDEVDTGRLAVG